MRKHHVTRRQQWLKDKVPAQPRMPIPTRTGPLLRDNKTTFEQREDRSLPCTYVHQNVPKVLFYCKQTTWYCLPHACPHRTLPIAALLKSRGAHDEDDDSLRNLRNLRQHIKSTRHTPGRRCGTSALPWRARRRGPSLAGRCCFGTQPGGTSSLAATP